MTRWHAASCERPKVELSDDKWPFCVACGKSCPPLEELILADQASNTVSVLDLPPDEPQGQMNLYWPTCVRYITTDDSATVPQSFPIEQPQHRADPANSMDLPAYIYGSTLGTDEFRIAHVSASRDADSPVHVTLETYLDDNHPEYETVSYLWGGEDGDSSSCRPIFIGEYWDVLLQTKNCLSALRFMRPLRGERNVWIDALCINQRNIEERAVQVGKMRRIYRRCTRVVAYLGDDIVSKSSPFPRYRTLDQLADAGTNQLIFPVDHPKYGQPFTLKEMLERRFFTRIWIVQELILPGQAVFRIGNVDFLTDPKTMFRLDQTRGNHRENLGTSTTPWFQYTNQQGFASEDASDVYALLKSTQHCHMSDPRDRVFGVIALLRDLEIQRSFFPDYSLSHLHFCIGLFGHWILNQGIFQLLAMAQTLDVTDIRGPTWLPGLGSVQDWKNILSPYSAKHRYRDMGVIRDNDDHHKCLGRDCIVINITGSFWMKGRTPHIHSFAASSWSEIPRFWSNESYINRFTGGLTINLIHLFDFEEQPRMVQRHERYGFLYSIHGATQQQPMGLYAFSPIRLDKLVCPYKDRLFMLDGGNSDHENTSPIQNDHVKGSLNILYLILRLNDVAHGRPLKYKLLTANLCLFEARDITGQYPHWKKHPVISHGKSRDSPVNLRVYFSHSFKLDDICPDPRENVASTIDCLSNIIRSLQSLKALDVPNESALDQWILGLIHEHHQLHFSIKGVWQQILPAFSKHTGLAALRSICRTALTANPTGKSIHAILLNDPSLKDKISSCYYSLQIPCEQWVLQSHYYILKSLDVREEQDNSISFVPAAPRKVFEEGQHPTDSRHKQSPQVKLHKTEYNRYYNNPGEYLRKWCYERRSIRREDDDYALLQLYVAVEWEWRHDTETTWHKTAHANYPRSTSQSSTPPVFLPGVDVHVRAPWRQVEAFIQEELKEILPPLTALMDAYQPPLSFDQAWELVLAGSTEEQKLIGVPKVIGGIKMDGSTHRVEIL